MANYDEERVNAVAEKCWWRYTSKRKLVEEFNLTENQIDELRKTPRYRSKVLDLMVGQRRSRAEFEKWIKYYGPNFSEWFGQRMGLCPEKEITASILEKYPDFKRNTVKCLRLFRRQFRKVKISFFVEIP